MQHSQPIEIVICDDHPLILEGVTRFIERTPNFHLVGTAFNAATLKELFKQTSSVDVLLLDIVLPDENGIEVCAFIKKHYPATKILVITNINDKSIILKIISNGASGYLLKTTPMSQIEEAIRVIYDGGTYFGKEAQNSMASAMHEQKRNLPLITRREREVLEFVEMGLTSTQIAERINISTLTVETHRRNLLQKFGEQKIICVLQRAKDLGLL